MQLDNPVLYFFKLYITASAAAALPTSPSPAAARRGAAPRQRVRLCGELGGYRSRAVEALAAPAAAASAGAASGSLRPSSSSSAAAAAAAAIPIKAFPK